MAVCNIDIEWPAAPDLSLVLSRDRVVARSNRQPEAALIIGHELRDGPGLVVDRERNVRERHGRGHARSGRTGVRWRHHDHAFDSGSGAAWFGRRRCLRAAKTGKSQETD